jgi:hypothetical protein
VRTLLIQAVSFAWQASSQFSEYMALPFSATTTCKVGVFFVKAKMVLNNDDFRDIFKASEQGCNSFRCHIGAMPATTASTSHVKYWRQASSLETSTLLCSLNSCW